LAALDVLTADPGTHLHRTHLHRTCGASQVQVCSALQAVPRTCGSGQVSPRRAGARGPNGVQVCVRGKWNAEMAETPADVPWSHGRENPWEG